MSMLVTLGAVVLVGGSIGYLGSIDDPTGVSRASMVPSAVLLAASAYVLFAFVPSSGYGPPVLAISMVAGSALAAGIALRRHPLAKGMGYLQRVGLGFRHTRLLREYAAQQRHRDADADRQSRAVRRSAS